jgi:glycosyltransferase involved in cell wall biosynthesis
VAKPKVTVVIPTHNRAGFIGRCVRSALAQTLHDIEVIVVDDASTDETPSVVGAFADPRVRVIALASRSGPSAARNRGIEAAQGRFVAFLDSDDEWLPSKLERQVDEFDREGGFGVVFTGVWLRRGSKYEPEVATVEGDAFDAMLSYRGRITTTGLMFDREVVGDELCFDEAFPAMQERELIIRVSRHHRVGCVLEPLYVWNHHPHPRVSDPQRQIAARRMIIEKYASDLASRPKLAAFHYFRLALVQHRVGEVHGARLSIEAASRFDPSNIRLRALCGAGRIGALPLVLALSTYVLGGRIRAAVGGGERGQPRARLGTWDGRG